MASPLNAPVAVKKKKKKKKKKDERSGAQYHCDYCRRDISNVVRIRCAECADFDLCLECFSVGVEVFPHLNSHKYRVIDHVTTPIFDEEWGADEELLLLEAIEMYGLGNWSDVADHVGTKSRQKCEDHYYEVYLNSATAPLPDASRPLIPKGANLKKDAAKSAERQKSKPAPRKGALGSLIGYIPNRGDFDVEYENDAEHVLADMEFKPTDTEQERELKLKVLQIYNEKLDTRMERKQFIIERGLLDPPNPRRSPEERKIEESVRVFARYHSKEEHERFIQGLVNEMHLRRKIEQLQNYRLNGIRTFEDGRLFDAETKGRKASPYNLDVDTGRKRRGADDANARKGKKRKGAKGAVAQGNLDISHMNGYELLSEAERKLCCELRLVPRHYITVKDTILQQSYARGFLQKGKVRQLISIDVKKTDRILDFFVSVGWVKEPPASSSSQAAPSLAARKK